MIAQVVVTVMSFYYILSIYAHFSLEKFAYHFTVFHFVENS